MGIPFKKTKIYGYEFYIIIVYYKFFILLNFKINSF